MSFLVLSPHVRYILEVDTGVLLDLKRGKCFGVNRVGGEICAALRDGATPKQIVGKVAAKYQVKDQVAEGDVREFLQNLLDKHLVETKT